MRNSSASPPTPKPKPIGPIQESRVFDFLMLAHAVEPHGLGEFHIAAKRRVVGGSQAGVGPISLVERESKVKRVRLLSSNRASAKPTDRMPQ